MEVEEFDADKLHMNENHNLKGSEKTIKLRE